MDELQRSFHLKEFDQLHVDINEILKGNQDVMKYVLISSGAVFAWLATNGAGEDKCVRAAMRWAAFIPTIMTLIGGLVTWIGVERVKQMGDYLRGLEDVLGHEGWGWERRLNKIPPMTNYLLGGFWGVLLIGYLAAALNIAFRACAVVPR